MTVHLYSLSFTCPSLSQKLRKRERWGSGVRVHGQRMTASLSRPGSRGRVVTPGTTVLTRSLNTVPAREETRRGTPAPYEAILTLVANRWCLSEQSPVQYAAVPLPCSIKLAVPSGGLIWSPSGEVVLNNTNNSFVYLLKYPHHIERHCRRDDAFTKKKKKSKMQIAFFFVYFEFCENYFSFYYALSCSHEKWQQHSRGSIRSSSLMNRSKFNVFPVTDNARRT